MEGLTRREELDFHYLLTLLPPLTGIEEYSWLPELFSIIGHEKLILLTKYAGGETIRIPTTAELADAIDALQWYYSVNIDKSKEISKIPEKVRPLYDKIEEVYHAR